MEDETEWPDIPTVEEVHNYLMDNLGPRGQFIPLGEISDVLEAVRQIMENR